MNFCFNTKQLLNICPGQWENKNRDLRNVDGPDSK